MDQSHEAHLAARPHHSPEGAISCTVVRPRRATPGSRGPYAPMRCARRRSQASVRAAISLAGMSVAASSRATGSSSATALLTWCCGSALGRVRSPGREVHRSWPSDDDMEIVPVGVNDAELVDLGLDAEAAVQDFTAVGGSHRLAKLERVVGGSNHSQALAVGVN